jgi:glutamyl-tRNA synthetase
VLRSEDLDRTRCRREHEQQMLEDLDWLGLDWDGELLRQSDDLGPYHAALDRLEAAGHAYPCVCTRRQILEALDAPHASGEELRYPGTCRGLFRDRNEAEQRCGVPAGLRLALPTGWLETVDRLRGPVSFCPAAECGDFLLLRRDGMIAYQLAVVVDDSRQGVDQVVRGDDLLPSTVRQERIYSALGLPAPAWYHLPLVLDEQGRRLSKRGGAPALAEWRRAGLDPLELVGWCAASLGLWSGPGRPPLKTPAQWLVAWDWSLVPLEPVLAPELPASPPPELA